MRKIVIFISLVVSVKLSANCDLNFLSDIEYQKEKYSLLEILDSDNLYNQELPEASKLNDFQAYVQSKTDPDPILLLKKQRAIYEQHLPEYVHRYDQIINGEVGKIKPMSCLVSTLMAKHLGLQSSYYNEFGAYILGNNNKLRIYFQSHNDAQVPSNYYIKTNIDKDVAQGWKLLTHIHSHPFAFDNPSGDIAGTLIPSGTSKSSDLGHYIELMEKHNLQSSIITNGFDMIVFKQEEFYLIDPIGLNDKK